MSRCMQSKDFFQRKGGVIESHEPFPFSFQVQLGTFRRPNNGITNVKRLDDGLSLVLYSIGGVFGGASEDT